ncbi:GNAT family N-acetyltransferase [Oceanirhabdus sp. W0125-5]|uniref:GNAT family N-acetyltransferase n=1 Tax=Oceanirhabdus sp. W0125-5 TaxID=2999116 RepID=UPI0022F32EB8|nr:GNAT family N-acetyltransferase [Oceanirhabdus sp. W0125-5]WBW96323.1 GNAT family N-acetyltransferase [Oceanirhabdus sp. W0125-5]
MSENALDINLKNRELDNVKRFWNVSKDSELKKLFPFLDNTLEEAIDMYDKSLLPDATSYGKTIYVNDCYIGDVWCYCIDEKVERSCFLSIVIFDKNYWSKGIGAKVIHEFNEIIAKKYHIDKICAFTYKSNIASRRTLEKVGFKCLEEFKENDITSLYYELKL